MVLGNDIVEVELIEQSSLISMSAHHLQMAHAQQPSIPVLSFSAMRPRANG